ncbi:MAG TPA: DUF2914 domain-containing protein [Terriglobia bacterium]|nr:DUF2914 domain-containing protein [Terriglobia bacterium]
MSQLRDDPFTTSAYLPIPIKSFLLRLRSWYGRFERPISSLSVIAGFVFDAVALRRVDVFWDNFWVVAHLAIVTACAVWINLLDDSAEENGMQPEANPRRLHFWLVNVMQFFFGGIISVYLVFYFRSGTIATSWPFLSLLGLTFIANGSLKRRFSRLWFQIALLFLAFYAFAIYMMPILLHEVSTRVFWLSSAVSVAAIALILLVVAVLSRRRFAGGRGWLVFGSLAGILTVVNTLYFLNVIPPLPLSLKDAGVYHSLVAKGPGDYTVTVEPQSPNALASIEVLARFLAFTQAVHVTPGESLVVYTAVFAPTALSMKIIHEWQYYDQATGTWITRHRVPLAVVGGRGGGYRTFSRESGITAGRWRVNVETQSGQLIGRLNFNAVVQSEEPPLLKEIIS